MIRFLKALLGIKPAIKPLSTRTLMAQQARINDARWAGYDR